MSLVDFVTVCSCVNTGGSRRRNVVGGKNQTELLEA